MISFPFLSPSFSPRIRTGLLVLLFLALVVSLTPATDPSQAAPPPGDGLALDTFLNPDGTLNLPPEGVLGSIDPTGYQLVSAEGEAPRFVPAEGDAPEAGMDNANWDPRFNLPGIEGTVYALAWDGTNLYIAGNYFITAGNVLARSIARWDGTNWSALGTGLFDWGGSQVVYALVWDGIYLYAGGDFLEAGGVTVNNIARWDGNTWSALGMGTDNTVYALALDGTNLYVGGGFTMVGGMSASHIAQWDGVSWSALGSGMSGTVYALLWNGTNLFAGGQISFAGGVQVNHIARWDGTNWNALGTGMDDRVRALAWDGINLYAGGSFTTAGGVTVNHVARWDGTAWHMLNYGVNGLVYALAWDGNNLYVGGDFATTVTGLTVSNIARWNGTTWNALSTGVNFSENPLLGQVNTLAWSGTDLFVGGMFDHASGTVAYRIARWNSTSWKSLGSGEGVDREVYALTWDGSDLYAAGWFMTAGGVAANSIARWDGISWHALGSGLQNGSNPGYVYALAWNGTNLYASGLFVTAGGITANNIARWDGTTWHALGTGVNNYVQALIWQGTNLYAGGYFTTAGGSAANRVARWDGTAWNVLGTGMNGPVNALVWNGTSLYAGGAFTMAGSASASNIARWSGGVWTGVSGGVNGPVYALAQNGVNVYVGGGFTTAGGITVNHIARWNSNFWNAMGTGMSGGNVRALVWGGTSLYAGGSFNTSGGITTNGIARWGGGTWHALGIGTNYDVLGLAWDGNSFYPSLYVGGNFEIVGNKPSSNFARWRQAAVWDGGGSDQLASTAANWSGDTVPLTTDVAIFDRSSSKTSILDASFPLTLAGIVVEDSYSGMIIQTQSLTLINQLQLHGGLYVLPDPAVGVLTVQGEVVHTGGTLEQIQPVNAASVPFLHIEDGAGNVQYRGVNVDTTSGSNLGETTVSIQAIDTSEGEYCTLTGNSSPAYTGRCYTITPTTDGPALVRLWALTSELNGIPESDLSVYHHQGLGAWNELDTNRSMGNDGNTYFYAEGQTPGFSAFLLGEQGNAPTALVLQSLTVGKVGSSPFLVFVVGILIILLAGWYWTHTK